MPSEKDLILAQLARDNKFITDDHIQECIAALQRKRVEDPAASLQQMMVDLDFLTTSQLERLEKIRQEKNKTHLIDGFEIRGLIGQGAMGAVYRGVQLSMNRPVALKVLNTNVVRNERFLNRFKREAQTTGRLSHPNIVQGIDVGECDGIYYFAMEYVDGNSLSELLEMRRYTEHEGIDIILQIAKALDHLHEHGLVHRDVKPENIMITRKGRAKLADLGLAKAVEEDSHLTIVGTIVGTPLYISPEQARGEDDIDIRSDIYSLGVTFYHLVTGGAPWDGMAPTVIMTKHITEDIPSTREADESLSPEVDRVIRRMCYREKDRRYQEPSSIIEDLEHLLGGSAPLESSTFARIVDDSDSQSGEYDSAIVPRETMVLDVQSPPAPPPIEPAPVRAAVPPDTDRLRRGRRASFRFGFVPSDEEVYFALIALKNNLIDPIVLGQALDHQEDMAEAGAPRRLDEILVEKGYLKDKYRHRILKAQKDVRRKDREALFGRVAIEMRVLSRDQIKRGLKAQQELRDQGRPMRLGDVLHKLGYLRFADKIEILSTQIKMWQERDEKRFGVLAVEAGLLTEIELAAALEKQRRKAGGERQRIGEVLVGMGAMSGHARSALLRAQRRQELLGGDILQLINERRSDLPPPSEPEEESQGGSGLFGNLQLKSPRHVICPYCEEQEVVEGVCRACGKEIG